MAIKPEKNYLSITAGEKKIKGHPTDSIDFTDFKDKLPLIFTPIVAKNPTGTSSSLDIHPQQTLQH